MYLYKYYRQEEAGAPTFAEVFTLSQEYKLNVENRSVNTITRNWNAYHRFITDSFGSTDITAIFEDLLNRYIT